MNETTPFALPARFVVLWDEPTDADAFERHYRRVHVPLACRMPGLRRYSLSRAVGAIRGEPYYLVAVLEWDDLAALRAAFDSEPGRATAADVAILSAGQRCGA